ncbi:hypothetical protein AAC387_Pa09g1816 [Persea americana]
MGRNRHLEIHLCLFAQFLHYRVVITTSTEDQMNLKSASRWLRYRENKFCALVWSNCPFDYAADVVMMSALLLALLKSVRVRHLNSACALTYHMVRWQRSISCMCRMALQLAMGGNSSRCKSTKLFNMGS